MRATSPPTARLRDGDDQAAVYRHYELGLEAALADSNELMLGTPSGAIAEDLSARARRCVGGPAQPFAPSGSAQSLGAAGRSTEACHGPRLGSPGAERPEHQLVRVGERRLEAELVVPIDLPLDRRHRRGEQLAARSRA